MSANAQDPREMPKTPHREKDRRSAFPVFRWPGLDRAAVDAVAAPRTPVSHPPSGERERAITLCFAFTLVMGMSLAGEEQARGVSLSLAELKNAVYRSPWTRSGTAPLTDGEYRETAAPASATQTRVQLTDWIAFGTVDGEAAAAVVLVTDPGGSGIFYDLALIVRRNGGLTNPATAHLGPIFPRTNGRTIY